MRWVLSLAVVSTYLYANPSDPSISHGCAVLEAKSSKHLAIHAKDKTIIRWKDFSIAADEVAEFIQPSKHACVLNKVTGGKTSKILGGLQANGKVYLINPQGIVIGKEAVINTAGFIASSLDLLDEDFIEGKNLHFKGDSFAAVENYGKVSAEDGDVFLIGYRVVQNGTLQAPQGVAGCGAGLEIMVQPLSEERIFVRAASLPASEMTGVMHQGLMEAVQTEIKADGSLYSLAVRSEGKISASRAETKEGRVFLVAPKGRSELNGSISSKNIEISSEIIDMQESATLDVGSGTVGARAEFIRMMPGSSIRADGAGNTDGGIVTLIAEHTALFHGAISAEGGKEGGNGGFIEVSGKKGIETAGTVSTAAPRGNTGTFLIDPSDINIQANGGVNTALTVTPAITAAFPYAGNANNKVTVAPDNTMAVCILDTGLLQTYLATTNVIVSTSPSMFGGGVITVVLNNPITWASDNSLSLIADTDIILNDGISCTGGGNLTLQAQQNISINNTGLSPGIQMMGGDATTNFISITSVIAPSGNITINAPVTIASGNIDIETDIPNGGAITITNNIGCTQSGFIVIQGQGDINIGSATNNVEIFTPDAGNGSLKGIDITSQGTVNLQANGIFHTQVGCNLDTLNTFSSIRANIDINSGVFAANAAVTLSAGGLAGGYVQIGHRGGSNLNTGLPITLAGECRVLAGGTSTAQVVLQGGGGNGAYAQIGHTPSTNAMISTTIESSAVTIGTIDLNIFGGTSTDTYALIGHGGLATAAGRTTTYTAQQTLTSPGNFFPITTNTSIGVGGTTATLRGGTATGSFAAIGIAGSPSTLFSSPAAVNTILFGATTQPTIDLTAGTGASNAGAYIGIFLYGNNPGSITSPMLHDVTLSLSSTMAGGGSITLTGPSAAVSSFAAIGTGNSLAMNNEIAANLIIQSVSFGASPTATLSLNANMGTAGSNGEGGAFIQNGIGASNPVFQKATTFITVPQNITVAAGANSSSFISNLGDALLIAGNNVTISGTPGFQGYVSCSFNNLMIVTDFSSGSALGPGGFNLDANSHVSTTFPAPPSAPVYIWTSTPSQNTVSGMINGTSFMAGFTHFGVVWHAGFTATDPYAIFYKDTGP